MIERKDMTDREQRLGAGTFVAQWKGRGYEKGETQLYWLSLLREVFGVKAPDKYISFEKQVKIDGSTKFIDGYISQTRVLIEQKNIDVVLTKKAKQSDGQMLTPFQQAVRYSALLSFDERPRWIVVSNFAEIHVHDMTRPGSQPEIIRLEDLPQEAYRLKFLIQDDAEVGAREQELSVKAGELVGKLYDELFKGYKDPTSEFSLHSLNALCVRLVFCLYAEDAGIFGRKKMFHDYLAHYKDRPSDVREKLLKLFEVLDTKEEARDAYLDEELVEFPYVNGSLFANAQALEVPRFSQKAVDILLKDASDGFDWSEISPTIFGAVFESTLNPETRRNGGMHYTSIENIHKVIDPLFLNELKDELARARSLKNSKERKERLTEFQKKLSSLNFLDPACGSGNFLTETYLSLRKLENEVLRIFAGGTSYMDFGDEGPIHVHIHQFYGIEINDFACAVAKTALWIAESQMLKQTEDIIKRDLKFLPLKSYINIHEGNALRIDWTDIVQADKLNYIMGNPPFRGHQWRNDAQHMDMELVFKGFKKFGKLDYVLSWFKKTMDFIKGKNIQCAFVATNSVVQGESVATFWKPFFDDYGAKINFAYRSFIWESEAADSAAVHCVIIGFSDVESEKIIFDNDEQIRADHINGYLLNAPDVFIENRATEHIDRNLPKMSKGSQPTDGGGLILSESEAQDLKNKHPEIAPFIREYLGGEELINAKKRYCLWLRDASPSLLSKAYLKDRLEIVKATRQKSPTSSVREFAEYPYLFTQIRQPDVDYLAVPEVSSENRRYIPIAFLSKSIIASNKLYLIPEATLFMFGVLVSDIHMEWMRLVAGRLEMRYSYSPAVYMNFPFPKLDCQKSSDRKKIQAIENSARKILEVRSRYSECSLADLYDRIMKQDLLEAHKENNEAVRQAYGLKAKASVTESLGKIVMLYMERREKNRKESAIDKAVKSVIGKMVDPLPQWMNELRQLCMDGVITTDELIRKGKAKKKELAAEERKAKKRVSKN